MASKKLSQTEKAAIKVATITEFSIFPEQINHDKGAFDLSHEK